MKKQILFLAFSFILKFSVGQILCVQCFDQNDSVYAGGVNLIQNGGFENTTCGFFPGSNYDFCPNATAYTCDIVNWICLGGGTQTYCCFRNGNTWFVEEGARSPYFGNSYCLACSAITSDISCFNNSGCIVTGIPAGYPLSGPTLGGTAGISLSQTVNGLTPGIAYVLEFWTGGEANTYITKGLFAVDVGFGYTFLRNPPTPHLTGIGSRFLIEFIATSSSHTIKFTNWGHICPTCTELVLDDAKLYQWTSIAPPCNGTVGITNPTETQITIYPNPATSQLTVTTANNQPSQIIIYDITSRKIMEQKFIGTATLNIETLAKGIYFYEVMNGKQAVKGKVVKE